MTRDLAGQRFGKLTAVRPIGRRNRYVLWECKCDCGNTAEVTTDLLTGGKVKSCGCMPTGRKRVVHKGKRFGRLTAVDPIGKGSGPRRRWRCVCTCGGERAVSEDDLLSGKVTNCGCADSSAGGFPGIASAPNAESARVPVRTSAHKPRMKDVAGQRFGDLTAIEPTDRREAGSVVWLCRCTCGREVKVSLANLKRRKHPTCGYTHNQAS